MDCQPVCVHVYATVLRHQVGRHRKSRHLPLSFYAACHSVRISFSGKTIISIPICFCGHNKPQSKNGKFRKSLFSMIVDLYLNPSGRFYRIDHFHFRRRNCWRNIYISHCQRFPFLFLTKAVVIRRKKRSHILTIQLNLNPVCPGKQICSHPHGRPEGKFGTTVIICGSPPESGLWCPVQPLPPMNGQRLHTPGGIGKKIFKSFSMNP